MTGADRNVTIWDAENGRQLFALAKQADAVTGVAFSPDGQVLATAGADGTIKLWRGDASTVDAYRDPIKESPSPGANGPTRSPVDRRWSPVVRPAAPP
jgi:WD40 repeat protein